jgi:hypothetical protein
MDFIVTLSITTLSKSIVIILSVIMLSVTFLYCHAERHYAEFCYVERRGALQ